MNDVDRRQFEMLGRVREFGTLHADLFPPSTPGAVALARVDAGLAALTEHAVSQHTGITTVRTATTSKASARQELRDDLQAIARTARVLASTLPGLDQQFRAPRGGSDQALLTAARTFARDAAPLAQHFIDHYLPDDFLADLEADIRQLEEAIAASDAGRSQHLSARALMDDEWSDALDAVRDLDALVPNRVRGNRALLAAWQSARQVEYPARKRKPADAAASAAPDSAAGLATT